jgi:hypothetical protein
MFNQKLISVQELSKYGPVSNLNEQAVSLVKQQQETWELARKNYAALSEVQTRNFDFGHFQIQAQYNPGRMRSSAAKTDKNSIAGRPCFLCTGNLPEEQKAIDFQGRFLILANPFPIFPVHLTIAHREHIPQRIAGFIPDMLNLSRELTQFSVFYNGPECGASAPDHFHFQAGSKGLLPVEKEFETLEGQASVLFQNPEIKIVAVENYLRRFVVIVSSHKEEIVRAFHFLYSLLPTTGKIEPMLNAISYYQQNKWILIIFPRERQRPYHFFQKGKNQVIVGPAAVEMGGNLILPRKEDFLSLEHKTIFEIYTEVTIAKDKFELMINSICTYK